MRIAAGSQPAVLPAALKIIDQTGILDVTVWVRSQGNTIVQEARVSMVAGENRVRGRPRRALVIAQCEHGLRQRADTPPVILDTLPAAPSGASFN